MGVGDTHTQTQITSICWLRPQVAVSARPGQADARSRSSTWVSHVDGRAQAVGPSSAPCLDELAVEQPALKQCSYGILVL